MPGTENNEIDLITRLKQKDERSFNELVKMYKQKLINGSFKITLNYDISEEITQETFLSFYLSVGNFNKQSGIYTYLFRIMLNKSIDYLRKKKRYEKISSSMNFDGENHDRDPELKIMLDQALNQLPLKLRIPLVLVEYEQLKYDEVSEVLKIPLNTVRTLIFKAREKLFKIFKSMGVEL